MGDAAFSFGSAGAAIAVSGSVRGAAASSGAIRCDAPAFVTGLGSEHAGCTLLARPGIALVGATFALRK